MSLQKEWSWFSPESLIERFTALGKGALTKNVIWTVLNKTPTTLEDFTHQVFADAYLAQLYDAGYFQRESY